jgi:hypothetical protein
MGRDKSAFSCSNWQRHVRAAVTKNVGVIFSVD